MPPPTVVDPWLAGRHFGIVIDAGSSGSRLQIYSWTDPRTITLDKNSPLAHTLPKVEKGTQDDELWYSKVEPGLSSLADDPTSVGAYLRPLLHHAREHVPPSRQHDTPLFLLATAGMRLLTPEKQARLLQETCRFLVTHSNFKIDDPTAAGPCGSSVRIITGEEEGLFGWIAVNYLMDGFKSSSHNRTTYGFLDMGGASTQIAFEPSIEHQNNSTNLMDVRLRLLNGEEISHKVFVTTWLGYGTNQARERYVGKLISDHKGSDTVKDPCLPNDLTLTETPASSSTQPNSHASTPHHLIGTGSFEQCVRQASSLLNKSAPCPDTPCLMNGVHVPPIDFSVSHFIGVSEYWFSSEHVFNLGGAYNYVQYERAAAKFCQRDWRDILEQHELSRASQRLGGDGEVVKDGQVVKTGVWGPKVEIPRLQMQCFKAAWIVNVLHEGIGMPRLVDPGGNDTTEGDKVAEKAEEKGLGGPTFQSVDTVGDIAISWTLGKMVIEASKEVLPLEKTSRPIVDPIDDVEDLSKSPIKPIRPPFLSLQGLEESISPHLPPSLTRPSLGFSPLLVILAMIFFICLLAYPIRRHLRTFCLRSVRKASRRDTYNYNGLLEEGIDIGTNGHTNGTHSSPSNPYNKRWLPSLKQMLPNGIKLSTFVSGLSSSKLTTPPIRSTPSRSMSMSNPSASTSQYMHASLSRAPSPSPAFIDDSTNGFNPLTSRSRNSSQINLSSLAARPVALSRANSMYYINGNKYP